jgi:hypothetical protein
MRSRSRSGPAARREARHDLVGVAPGDRRAVRTDRLVHLLACDEVVDGVGIGGSALAHDDRTELEHRLPLGWAVGRRREERRRVVRDVPDRELEEADVVVRHLERREPGQDDVRVPRRLVEIDVAAHHELERRERLRERPPFGFERAGLPAIVMSARICPSPGVSISSARHATGSSPNTSGVFADAARPAPEADALAAAGDAARVDGADGGLREHRAAVLVEVAR